MTEKQKSMTHRLVLMAMFVAVQIILSRFLSINLWNLKIGFSFIPIVLAGILLGPLSAGLVGLVADVIGATLFPIGAFFPGFSLTSFITAFGYGFFLHKNQSMKNIVAAVLFSEIVGTIFLNTLWISILYGAPFVAVLIPRLAQAAGMGVVEVLCICFMTKYIPHKKTRNERSRQNRTKAAMAVLLRIRPVRAKPLKQNMIRNARKKPWSLQFCSNQGFSYLNQGFEKRLYEFSSSHSAKRASSLSSSFVFSA